MPTKILKRIWCKKCNNFELHQQHYPNWKDWFCLSCDTLYSDIKIKDIPSDKIEEQRKRYKENQKDQINRFLGELSLTPQEKNLREMLDLFSPPGSDYEIMESDAGQIALDKINREKKERERIRMNEIKEEAKKVVNRFKGLGRNDLCRCGSEIKYKKCCLQKIQKYEHDFGF